MAGWSTPTTTIDSMQTKPRISLENITVRLRDRPYLKDTSWQILPDENWAVLGPNGSGKTTFARSLLGQVPVVRGKIKYRFSEDSQPGWETIAQTMGYVAPELQREIVDRENRKSLFREFSGKTEEFTTAENLIVEQNAGAIDHFERNIRLREAVERIGIERLLERDVTSLTIGEMNSVLFARALYKRPKLLILDEPFEGLDRDARKTLADTIDRLAQTDIQLILITHRFEEIVSSITHVMLLKQGQIYRAGKKEAIFRRENIDGAYEMGPSSFQPNPEKLFSALPRHEGIQQPPNQQNPEESSRVLVKMQNVTVQYGPIPILDRFNWVVTDGENWMIRGPSAAGKSTVLSLIHADNLQAYANDIDLFGQKRGAGQSIWDIKRKIGFISSDLQLRQHQRTDAFEVVCSGFFDSNGLYRRCSVEQLAIAGAWSRFLEIDDLADRKFGRLSHGQRQLVLLARSMVKSPVFLILDGPFQGLDIKNKSKLSAVFNYIGRHTPTNIIYVPDQEDEKLDCITHVLEMERGKAIDVQVLGLSDSSE